MSKTMTKFTDKISGKNRGSKHPFSFTFSKRIFTYTLSLLLLFTAGVLIKKKILNTPEVEDVFVRPVRSQLSTDAGKSREFSFLGRIKAFQSADLSFESSGTVLSLLVKEGDLVEEGDNLARLENVAFQNRVQSARAVYQNAQADYQRYQNVYEEGAVALTEVERFKTAAEVARTELRIAERNLSETAIVAPFKGVIGKVFVEINELVASKQPIIFLQNIEILELGIDVPQNYVSLYRKGEIEASVSLPNAPANPYPLKLSEFSTIVDATSQTYEAKFTFPRPDSFLVLPGMSGDVKLRVQSESLAGRYFLPLSALFYDPETKTSNIWIVDEESSTVHKRVVDADSVEDNQVEIRDGLNEGERVVTAGATLLYEGQEVLFDTASQDL